MPDTFCECYSPGNCNVYGHDIFVIDFALEHLFAEYSSQPASGKLALSGQREQFGNVVHLKIAKKYITQIRQDSTNATKNFTLANYLRKISEILDYGKLVEAYLSCFR